MDSPLDGQHVVICRATRDAQPLVERLESHGAAVVSVPLVEPVAAADNGVALRAALADLENIDWLVATSTNGSRSILEVLDENLVGRDPAAENQLPLGLKLACVGSATAQVFRDVGLPVALTASVSSAAGLVHQFSEADGADSVRVLAVLGELASDEVVVGLRAKGYTVQRVAGYSTVAADIDAEVRREVAKATAVLFTSSSTVERFVALLGREQVPKTAVSIGPKTSETMKRLGVGIAAQAERHTQQGVVEALLEVVSTMGR